MENATAEKGGKDESNLWEITKIEIWSWINIRLPAWKAGLIPPEAFEEVQEAANAVAPKFEKLLVESIMKF